MKKSLLSLIFLSLVTMLAHAEEIDFSAASVSITKSNSIILDGIRVDGYGFTRDDALRVKYDFNLATLGFDIDMESLVVFQNVGIFHEQHMAVDVGSLQPSYVVNLETQTGKNEDITILPAGEPLNTNTDYPFVIPQGTQLVATIDLEMGHVFSWYLSGGTREFEYELTGPNTQIKGQIDKKEKLVSEPLKIFTPGTYEIKISIINPNAKNANIKINLFNNNHYEAVSLFDRTSINEKLTANAWDYLKYQVSLNPNEILELPASTFESIAMKLVNNKSQLVAHTGKKQPLVYKEESDKTQNYYLFIYDKDASGKRYSSKVSIKVEEPEVTEPEITEPSDVDEAGPDAGTVVDVGGEADTETSR